MNAHPHADLIKAWAEGATIQFFDIEHEAWVNTPRPQWDPDCQYRLAPRLVRYRVAVMKHKGGSHYTAVVGNTQHAQVYERSGSFVQWAGDWQQIAISTKEAVTS